MKLRCVSRYENREIAFNAGDEFDASESLYKLLMSDSPLSFEEVAEEPKTETPEGTKVVRKRSKK